MPLMISNKPFMRSNINNRVFRTRNYPDMLSYFNKKQVMGRRATDTTLQNIFHRNSPYKNYMSKTFVKTNFSKYNNILKSILWFLLFYVTENLNGTN